MRVVNRVLAVAAALALVAGGILVIAEIALASLGRGPWLIPYDGWHAAARAHDWDSSAARSLFLGLAVAGLVLVILQVARPRPRSIPLDGETTRAGIARRSLEHVLARAAGSETGVTSAMARIRGRRARVVATAVAPPDEIRPRVEQAAQAKLRELGLDGRLAVAVDVDRRHG